MAAMSIAERDDRDWVRQTLEDRGERYDPRTSIAFKLEVMGLSPEGLPWTPDYVRAYGDELLTYVRLLQASMLAARELHAECGGGPVYRTLCAYSWETGYVEHPDPEPVIVGKEDS